MNANVEKKKSKISDVAYESTEDVGSDKKTGSRRPSQEWSLRSDQAKSSKDSLSLPRRQTSTDNCEVRIYHKTSDQVPPFKHKPKFFNSMNSEKVLDKYRSGPVKTHIHAKPSGIPMRKPVKPLNKSKKPSESDTEKCEEISIQEIVSEGVTPDNSTSDVCSSDKMAANTVEECGCENNEVHEETAEDELQNYELSDCTDGNVDNRAKNMLNYISDIESEWNLPEERKDNSGPTIGMSQCRKILIRTKLDKNEEKNDILIAGKNEGLDNDKAEDDSDKNKNDGFQGALDDNLLSEKSNTAEYENSLLVDHPPCTNNNKEPEHICLKNINSPEVLLHEVNYNHEDKKTKLKSLTQVIDKCPEGADMKLSLFVTACANDVMHLFPFPETVLEDNVVSRRFLYYIAEEIPTVPMISFLLKSRQSGNLKGGLYPIVNWLLRDKDPRLELVEDKEHKAILSQVFPITEDGPWNPSIIFKIKNKRNGEVEESWQNVKKNLETQFAYHSTSVQDAFAVLYYGLHNGMNKEGIFGPGIYLSDDLETVIECSAAGNTWGKSTLASRVKLVFLAEFARHDSVITYSGEGKPFNQSPGDVSHKYHFLYKPKLVRLRYLLVYILKPSVLPREAFVVSPIKHKLMKILRLVRLAVIFGVVLMGASASTKSQALRNPFLMMESLQNCYNRISSELTQSAIWQYVELPYFVTPLTAEMPPSFTQMA